MIKCLCKNNYLWRWKMEYLELIFLFIVAHVFGDYVFQGEYIATTKSKNYYHLFVHCIIYTFCFWCVFFYLNKISFALLMLIFASHFIIDLAKGILNTKNPSNSKLYYGIDQLLHYAVILLITFIV